MNQIKRYQRFNVWQNWIAAAMTLILMLSFQQSTDSFTPSYFLVQEYNTAQAVSASFSHYQEDKQFSIVQSVVEQDQDEFYEKEADEEGSVFHGKQLPYSSIISFIYYSAYLPDAGKQTKVPLYIRFKALKIHLA